jgi:hypothetical protein
MCATVLYAFWLSEDDYLAVFFPSALSQSADKAPIERMSGDDDEGKFLGGARGQGGEFSFAPLSPSFNCLLTGPFFPTDFRQLQPHLRVSWLLASSRSLLGRLC